MELQDYKIVKVNIQEFKDTACGSYLWMQNGETYTQSGTYYIDYQGLNGCDSLVLLDLIINNIDSTSENTVECDSFYWPSNNQNYTSSGLYTTTMTNAYGCDSVVTLNLTINNSNNDSETISTCDSFYLEPVNG